MTRLNLWTGDEVVAGPFETREAAQDAQIEIIDDAVENGTFDDVRNIRPIPEWVVTEDYADGRGTLYLTNHAKKVTAFLEGDPESSRDWNAGLFDERNGCIVIEGSALNGVTRQRALCHLLSLTQHIDEYVPAE